MTEAELTAAIAALRPALRLHCYRMLGCASDAEDLAQEACLRAWRARGSLDDSARVKPWLYRIATNACLDEIDRKKRAPRLLAHGEPSPGTTLPPAPAIDAPWLEPIPDSWVSEYELRESVALAFVAALQLLSPPQRAALLLRDVVGMSAEECAAVLEQTVSAVNSALHRARQAVAKPATAPPVDAEVLARYLRALAAQDVDAMIALVHAEMHTTMPPSPTWIRGRADSVEFYRRMFARWSGLAIRGEVIGVSGAPGVAFSRDGVVTAIESIETRDGAIYRMHHFMQPEVIARFS